MLNFAVTAREKIKFWYTSSLLTNLQTINRLSKPCYIMYAHFSPAIGSDSEQVGYLVLQL